MHIALGVLAIPTRAPSWHRQDADLLIVANGFGWHARDLGKLANGEQSLHGRPSLESLWRKDTPSTDWKVKSKALSRRRSAFLSTGGEEIVRRFGRRVHGCCAHACGMPSV